MLHYLASALFIYIVFLLLLPQQVAAATLLVAAWLWAGVQHLVPPCAGDPAQTSLGLPPAPPPLSTPGLPPPPLFWSTRPAAWSTWTART